MHSRVDASVVDTSLRLSLLLTCVLVLSFVPSLFADHYVYDPPRLISSLHWYGTRTATLLLSGVSSVTPIQWSPQHLPDFSTPQTRVWQMCLTRENGYALVVPELPAKGVALHENVVLYCWGSRLHCPNASLSRTFEWSVMDPSPGFSEPLAEKPTELHCSEFGVVIVTNQRKLYWMGNNADAMSLTGPQTTTLKSLMDGNFDLGGYPSRTVSIMWYEGARIFALADDELWVRGMCLQGSCCAGISGPSTSSLWVSILMYGVYGGFPSLDRKFLSAGNVNTLMVLGQNSTVQLAYYCGDSMYNHYTMMIQIETMPTGVTCDGAQPYSDFDWQNDIVTGVRCVTDGCFVSMKNATGHAVFMSSGSSSSPNLQRVLTSSASLCVTDVVSSRFGSFDNVESMYFSTRQALQPTSYVATKDAKVYTGSRFLGRCGVDSSEGDVYLERVVNLLHPDWGADGPICIGEDECLMFIYPVCNGLAAHEVGVCGGHGVCNDTNDCVCEAAYHGTYCSIGGAPPGTTPGNSTDTALGPEIIAAIVGAAVACVVIVVVVLIVIVVAICVCKRRRSKTPKKNKNKKEMKLASSSTPHSDKALLKLHPELFEISARDVKLVKALGTGGFGEVFEIKWKGHRAAMKVFNVKDASSQEDYSDFEKEVSIMGSVSHPNLIRFFGCTLQKGGRIGIVMALAEGGDLPTYMADNDVSTKERFRLLSEISSGMAHLHSVGVIHRDLKPENVLVHEGSVRIVDFGVSKIVKKSGQAGTHTRAVGTSPYMAPEVSLGYKYGPKVDVFSMGIMMWCVWHCDFAPYGHDRAGSVETRVAMDPTFRPSLESDKSLSMPPWYRELMQACWSNDPGARPDFARLTRVLLEKAEGQ